MKPHRLLAATKTPDGASLTLHEHDGAFCIRQNGRELMHSAATSSELALGEAGTARLAQGRAARVLVGGLGLGFTLRSVLERAGPRTAVHVAELLPEIVAWNRLFLRELNGALLDDPRVELHVADVFKLVIQTRPAPYDAILLDLDNGPAAMVQPGNARLYSASACACSPVHSSPAGGSLSGPPDPIAPSSDVSRRPVSASGSPRFNRITARARAPAVSSSPTSPRRRLPGCSAPDPGTALAVGEAWKTGSPEWNRAATSRRGMSEPGEVPH